MRKLMRFLDEHPIICVVLVGLRDLLMLALLLAVVFVMLILGGQ